jgi:hypothetical protein
VSPLYLFALASVGPAQATESVTIAESECHAMVQNGEEVVSTRVPGLHVIERTGREGPFSASELPPGTSAIMCPRSSIVPAPNDWKVLEAGYPLYITENRAPPESRRVGALEVSQGQVRYRFVRGELADGEEAQIQARLNQLQEAGRQPSPPGHDD